VVNWYLAKLHEAAHDDGPLAHAFMRVANLLVPPSTLFAPKVMLRVLRGHRRRRRARASETRVTADAVITSRTRASSAIPESACR
jgi:hypothetical protein